MKVLFPSINLTQFRPVTETTKVSVTLLVYTTFIVLYTVSSVIIISSLKRRFYCSYWVLNEHVREHVIESVKYRLLLSIA